MPGQLLRLSDIRQEGPNQDWRWLPTGSSATVIEHQQVAKAYESEAGRFIALKTDTQDLAELSITRVRENDPATVKLDTIPKLELSGKVSRIGEFDKNKQEDIIYTVYITPDRHDRRLCWNTT